MMMKMMMKMKMKMQTSDPGEANLELASTQNSAVLPPLQLFVILILHLKNKFFFRTDSLVSTLSPPRTR